MGYSSEAKMYVYSDSGPSGEGKPNLQGQAGSVMLRRDVPSTGGRVGDSDLRFSPCDSGFLTIGP